MKALNGYKQPKFTCSKSGYPDITIELDLKYQALNESTSEVAIEHTLLSGEITKIFRYYRITWTLDASQNIEYNNSLKIKQLLNLYASGYSITLTPHIEVPRSYLVIINATDIALNNPFPPGKNSLGNPGLAISFTSKMPIYSLDWMYPPHILTASDSAIITLEV